MSKYNHKNVIERRGLYLDISNIMIFLACIIFIFLIGRFFLVPLKMILRIIGNSLIGGCIIFVVNMFGGMFGFHLGLNAITTVFVGILGVPRNSSTYYVENVFIKTKKVEKCIFLWYNFFITKIRRIFVMNSEQILQESDPILFGEGQRYESREEALEATKKQLQQVQTELALQRMFEKAETEIIELQHGYKIAVILNIPRFV